MALQISVDNEKLEKFCLEHHILRLAFFGSVLGDKFKADSDVDVLVFFDPAHIPGLFGISRMELELSKILGRKADLRTPNDLSKLFRDEVISKAEVKYAI